MKKKIIAVFLMLSVMCCTMITALAENVNIEHDDETDCVEISGNAGASMKKKNVKAVITYSETTFNAPSQQKWTQKSFKKRNESQYFVNLLKPTAFIPRFA